MAPDLIGSAGALAGADTKYGLGRGRRIRQSRIVRGSFIERRLGTIRWLPSEP
jgi:hypothetical protein